MFAYVPQAHGLDIYIDELTQPGAFIDLRLRTLLTFGWGRRGSSEASTRDATNNTTSSNSTESSAASSEPERSYSSSGSSSQSLDMGSNGCGAKPVMNLDFLFGPVMHDSKPLDWEVSRHVLQKAEAHAFFLLGWLATIRRAICKSHSLHRKALNSAHSVCMPGLNPCRLCHTKQACPARCSS